MTYKIVDLPQKEVWREALRKLPLDQQDIYYSPEYYSLYENYGDGKALCLIYEGDGEIALYPFLINSVNELGYDLDAEYYDIQGAYGYNGIISSSYSKEFISNFYNNFFEFCEKYNVIAEFTRFNPYLKNQNFSQNNLSLSLNRKTVILNLNQSYDDIWQKSYTSKNRNKIRKANKNGLIALVDNTDKGVSEFVNIYRETMRAINAEDYYYFNDAFFKNMLKSDYYNFLFVKDEAGNILAAMILMIYGNYAHYHLSGRASNCRDNSVNNFILDEAIKIAKNNGARFFHFGGGNSLDENDSLFKFKSNFSKENLDFYIGKKIHNEKIYSEVIRQWRSRQQIQKKNNLEFLLCYRG